MVYTFKASDLKIDEEDQVGKTKEDDNDDENEGAYGLFTSYWEFNLLLLI